MVLHPRCLLKQQCPVTKDDVVSLPRNYGQQGTYSQVSCHNMPISSKSLTNYTTYLTRKWQDSVSPVSLKYKKYILMPWCKTAVCISIANALEILQSCTKLLIYHSGLFRGQILIWSLGKTAISPLLKHWRYHSLASNGCQSKGIQTWWTNIYKLHVFTAVSMSGMS